MQKISFIMLSILTTVMLSSCAAGSATAAYSVKAHEADGLSAQAEQRIVDRVKRELKCECYPSPTE